MEKKFYIQLVMKTPAGYEHYARYFLGNDEEIANELFDRLAGTRIISRDHRLLMELTEENDETEIEHKVIGCTLAQLTENCRMITCELFNALTDTAKII